MDAVESRLPTLSNVLNRRTLPPICLYNFYIYLRDTEHCQFLLDFWLDVVAHENLAKLYCRDVIEQQLHRHSILSSGGGGIGSSLGSGPSSAPPERVSINRISLQDVNSELRFSSISAGIRIPATEPGSPTVPYPGRPSYVSSTHSQTIRASLTDNNMGGGAGKGGEEGPSSSYSPKERPKQRRKVARAEVKRSVERLYYRYIIPGAEREIPLSEELRFQIVQAVEVDKRDDPAVFEAGKEYVFGMLDLGPFPRFLQQRIRENITEKQAALRGVIGLVGLFVGLTTLFSLVFLDSGRGVRVWGLFPVWFGVGNGLVGITRFSPAYAMVKRSEVMFLKCSKVKDAYILWLHRRRAVMWSLLAFLIAVVIVMIFVAVPGYRL